MNDELQGTLAELASGLGTTTNELWTWLQGDGINAYAAAKVAQLGVIVAFITIALLCCIAACAVIYMTWRHSDKKGYWDDDCLFAMIIPLFLVGVVIILGVDYIGEFAGWIASPQGMVMQMFVDKFGG